MVNIDRIAEHNLMNRVLWVYKSSQIGNYSSCIRYIITKNGISVRNDTVTVSSSDYFDTTPDRVVRLLLGLEPL